MHFSLICFDKPDHLSLRMESRPAHLAHLKMHEANILVAGPLLDDAGRNPVGSLLIVEFDDLAGARAFADDDPYAKAGLFESVTIRPWRKVLP